MNVTWILKYRDQKIDCSSFPFAYRTAFNVVRKAIEEKLPTGTLISSISITGPPNFKGDRKTYSYVQATEMARSMGLLNSDDEVNTREFKKKKY